MSLGPLRTVSYTAAAFTGGFTAAALVAAREGAYRSALSHLGRALCCGALSVVCEELAGRR